MAETASTTITLGLCQILVSDASAAGTMPAKTAMTKIGKTYKDTANINQDAADVTEHFEEGKSAPEVRKKSKKIPKVTFSLMNPDPAMLAAYVGGAVDTDGNWGYDGDEVTANKAVYVETEQGLDFAIPNGDIEAVVNGALSASGIVLVDFTVTPCAVTTGKAIRAVKKTKTT